MSTTDKVYGSRDYQFKTSGQRGNRDKKRYYTLTNEKTGKVEVKEATLGGNITDRLVGTYDPKTKKFQRNTGTLPIVGSLLPTYASSTRDPLEEVFFSSPEGIKQIQDAAIKGGIKEQVQDNNLDPIVARKQMEDIVNTGSTNIDPNDSEEVKRIIGEERENLLGAVGRKRFGNLRYPEKMSENQDAIKFALLEFTPRSFDSETPGVLQDRERKTVEQKQILGSVVLPIPGGIRDQNSVSWSAGELNPAQALGAQATIAALSGGDSKVGDIIKGIADTASLKGVEDAAIKALSGAATGAGQQLIQRQEGAVFNPNVELLFNKPNLRSFNFVFNLSPRNSGESSEVKKIIRLFKQGMAVRKTPRGVFLRSPLVFQITYINNTTNLNRFKEAALTDFSVDYTPNGAYSTFRDGTMTQYKITMRYQELDPIFNSDYDELDNEEAGGIGFGGPLSISNIEDSAGIGF